MKKKVLIIGSGELTSYIVPLMVEKGYQITLTTTTPEKINILTTRFSKKVKVILLDGKDTESVQKAMEGKDIVIIAVAPQKSKVKSIKDQNAVYKIIQETYKNTTQSVVKSWQSLTSKPKVIYVSAQIVYANTGGGVVDENTPAVPPHFRGILLKEAENMILDWIPQSVALRIGWLLDARRNWGHLLELWKKFLPNYELPGNGKIRSNIVHIEDAARSVLFAIDNELEGIYNVCNDVHPYWDDLFEIVSQQIGIDPPNWNPDSKDQWFDPDHITLSQKIKNAGFVFKYPREMGLSFVMQINKNEDQKQK